MDLLSAATLFLVICLSCLTVLSTWRQMHRKSQMPPGPTPLPFIGNLLQVKTSDMYQSLLKISETFGPVFTIHLGPRRVVVLCGYDAVKEALVDQGEEFSGRGEQATFDWIFQGYGVAFSNGERAKQLRRFSIMTLRNFGMGRRSIEERILEEGHFLLEAIRSTKGAPFDPTYFLSRSVSNVISSITFGSRFDYEDKEFLSLLSMMLGSFRFTATSWGQLYEMFSGIMKYMPGPQHKAFKQLLGLEEFITRKVKVNLETLDPSCPRDYIDCFLVKMQQEKENPNSEFFLKNLILTTLNLFFAGTETVSTTLRYGFLLMLKHPEIEEKVHKEIDQVIGRNRIPNMEDRAQMPYTEAVIHEIQRFCDMIPMGLAHRVIKDTQFRGYTIPKGTEVFPMLGTVLRDPKYFARPDVFDPQHFLDENGKFKKSDAFMPFSIVLLL
ncbi:cytochrome P450 2A13-like isoform X2 [Hemicordylus capensis]|uniref:cytochrome P450 2A13-like isoform X2 n=1 Tax=Hemicordylus capensis TaxID=884348 RepID=UPI002302B63D|nr:cytochrome P450 2A13-like isoform X2 [Hemicordylus capensis]